MRQQETFQKIAWNYDALFSYEHPRFFYINSIIRPETRSMGRHIFIGRYIFDVFYI
jgi:hypothetical protein